MDEYPGTTTLAEVSSQEGAFERVGAYTAGDDQLHMAYTLRPLRGDLGWDTLRRLVADIAAADPRGWIAWSFSNHDVERAVTRWRPGPADPDFARLLLALLLTLRGSICLYQGEELGLPDPVVPFEDMRDPFGLAYYPEYRGRDGSRTPMPWRANAANAGFSTGKPWLPVEPAHLPLSVDRQEQDEGSMLWASRRLIAWRKRHPALIAGAIEPVDLPAPLIGFRRVSTAESILVVLNLSDGPVSVPAPLLTGTRPLDGHGFATVEQDGAAVLPRYGVLFAGAAAESRPALEPFR
jgi:alpha-glucosidase